MQNKQQLLTEPIKRFLIQCVAKSSSQPERLLNELELCERFSVSRRTVHKAVSDLLDIGYIQHLEGKRGIFSNPDYASVVPYSIGIVGSHGNCSYMDPAMTSILGEFLKHGMDLGFMTTFLTLNDPPAEADHELLKAGLDAVLFIQPINKYIPSLERAISRYKLPVIAIGSLSNPSSPILSTNMLGLDYAVIGEQYDAYYRTTEAEHILFCGRDGTTFRSLQKHWLKNGDQKTLDLFTDEDDLDTLCTVLKEKKIDSLICNGCNNLHHNVFKRISALPDAGKYSILLSPGLDLKRLKKEYSLLSMHSIHKANDLELYAKIGEKAAQCMEELLQKKDSSVCFNNIYFQWSLQ